MRLFICLAAALLGSCAPRLTGPVVGIPTPTADGNFQCKVLVHDDERGHAIDIRYWRRENDERRQVRMQELAREKPYSTPPPRVTTLDTLQPGAEYHYEIVVDGKLPSPPERWRGRFKTPPRIPQPFRVALASCMRYSHDCVQPGWKRLLDTHPDFVLLLGDNVYANSPDHDDLWRYHRYQRSVEWFRRVLLKAPIAAIWDDHDYGPNNSNGTLSGKENSLAAFGEVWWTNPGDSEEAYYRFSWGDVHFFALDGRYYRTDGDDKNATMLGKRQRRWLLSELKKQQRQDDSNGASSFKILYSGSPLATGRDSWRAFAAERRDLFLEIMREGISGLLYCAGDSHFSYVNRHRLSSPGTYPIYEVISSGIANDTSRHGYTQSFVTLDFDPDRREVFVEVHGTEEYLAQLGDSRRRIIRLEDLQVKGEIPPKGKFLYDRRSLEYEKRSEQGQLVDPYSAPLPGHL